MRKVLRIKGKIAREKKHISSGFVTWCVPKTERTEKTIKLLTVGCRLTRWKTDQPVMPHLSSCDNYKLVFNTLLPVSLPQPLVLCKQSTSKPANKWCRRYMVVLSHTRTWINAPPEPRWDVPSMIDQGEPSSDLQINFPACSVADPKP